VRRAIGLSALVAALAPGIAFGQAKVCLPPVSLPRPVPDLPTADQPSRVLPIGSYTLAITWSPQFCRSGGFSPAARFQCGSGNSFGFSLHGLWPDGLGKAWPQYCAAAPLLPPATIASMICTTPSAQLIQHEWAKHGTCAGMTPDAYFAKASRLYARLRYPDMNALSRAPLTVARFTAAFAAANPGVPASSVRVTASKGWLDELWLCLDTRFSYERCKAGTGGLAPDARLKIWRGSKR
jgi:ribonuclease T2